MTPDEVDAAIHEMMKYEDWDNNAYLIMQLYRNDKKQMLVSLTAHKIKLEKEKMSRVKTRLLDLAKKQNLSILQYDDNALTHRKKYSRWIKTVKSVITCFNNFQGIFDDTMKFHSLPNEIIE